jgi:hypothetical protein
MGTTAYRTAVVISFLATIVLLLVNFVQMADDVNPAARMYFPVPIVGVVSAAIARLRPNGMSRALFATALAQALALTIALIIRDPQVTPWTAAVVRGFGMNAFFGILFGGSALLFRSAGRQAPTPGLR